MYIRLQKLCKNILFKCKWVEFFSICHSPNLGVHNSGRQVSGIQNFIRELLIYVGPSSVWNFLQVTNLAPRYLKVCKPLAQLIYEFPNRIFSTCLQVSTIRPYPRYLHPDHLHIISNHHFKRIPSCT